MFVVTEADMMLDAFLKERKEGGPWKDLGVDAFAKVWGRQQESYREKAKARAKKGAVSEPAKKGFNLPRYVDKDPSTIPPREWLYSVYLIRKFVSGTVAPGATGKSSLTFVEGAAMATGLPLLGIKPFKQLNVAFWNEDPHDELERRVAAIVKHYSLDRREMAEHFFYGSGRDHGLKIASMHDGSVRIATPVVEEVVAFILANKIDVLTIDPFIKCHSVPENLNEAIDVVVAEWGRIADRTNCAISLVSHTRKPMNGATRKNTTADARGAGSYIDGLRIARAMTVMSVGECGIFGVPQEKRKLFMRVTDGKVNMSPPTDTTIWFKMESVALGNATSDRPEDSVGVATLSDIATKQTAMTNNQISVVQGLIAAGEYRESVQATIGRARPSRKGLVLTLTIRAIWRPF